MVPGERDLLDERFPGICALRVGWALREQLIAVETLADDH